MLEGILDTSMIRGEHNSLFAYVPIGQKSRFDYGVLQHRITGAFIYGPPGTGKTTLVHLLAKRHH